MATVQRTHDPSLGDVVVKQASDPAGRARLAREAAVLERTRHPCVVELLRHTDDDDRAELVTRVAGKRTVEDLSDLAGDQAAAFGAALAQTLADLHRAGISHGAVRAEHVVVSDLGQPVLCGLGGAGLVEPPPGQWGGFDPAADVGAVADVLAAVLEPADGLRRWSGGVAGVLRRADERSMDQLAADLAAMAGPLGPPLRLAEPPLPAGPATIDLTTEGSPVARPRVIRTVGSDRPARPTIDAPTADRATGVEEAWLDEDELDDHPFWADPPEPETEPLVLGDASTVDRLFGPGRSFGPRPPRPDPDPARRWPARRWVGLALLALLAVVAGATTVAALSGSPASVGAPPAPEPAPEPAPASDPTPTTAVPAGCPASYEEAAVVGVPSTCTDRLSTVANQVSVGELRWVVGADGDLAVAGDFDCDGWLEVASVSSGGDVAVFESWAGAGQEPVGRIVGQVAGARGVTATPRDGCHELVVERTDLPPVTVALAVGR